MSDRSNFIDNVVKDLPSTYSNSLPVKGALMELAGAMFDADGSMTPADLSVTLAKMAEIATPSIMGRVTAGSGAPEVLSIAQVDAIILKAAANIVGTADKTSYNKLTGYSKVDNRPVGGATNAYALQVRSESGNTTGQQWGVDCEAHLKATGDASVRAVQGVAVVDSTFTASAATIIGAYGQARVDGDMDGASFLAGLYGLIEASTALTAAHVAALWLDTHQANAITGSYQLMYLTENGVEPLDQVMYLRTPGAKAFAEFEQCDTFISDTAETGGTAKKIKITIDGVDHWINAYPGA